MSCIGDHHWSSHWFSNKQHYLSARMHIAWFVVTHIYAHIHIQSYTTAHTHTYMRSEVCSKFVRLVPLANSCTHACKRLKGSLKDTFKDNCLKGTRLCYCTHVFKRLKGSLNCTFKDNCLKGTCLHYCTHASQRLKGAFTDNCPNGTNQQTNH